jgi:flavin-dependent dehydrogenase
VEADGSWDLIYHVLRANFDGTSSDYLKSAEDKGSASYEYGCNVTGIKVDDGGVTVEYTDRDKRNRTQKSDRVFAADGPSSTIRGILLPDTKRTYAGYVTTPDPPLNFGSGTSVGGWRRMLMVGCLEGDGFGDIGVRGDETGFCGEVYFLSCKGNTGIPFLFLEGD